MMKKNTFNFAANLSSKKQKTTDFYHQSQWFAELFIMIKNSFEAEIFLQTRGFQ